MLTLGCYFPPIKIFGYGPANKLRFWLQTSLTMPNLPLRGRRELSTGLQSQQKEQNRIAITH